MRLSNKKGNKKKKAQTKKSEHLWIIFFKEAGILIYFS